ncbi:MAG: hypothetical protein N2C14_27795 [Planctomycetales bacterium]
MYRKLLFGALAVSCFTVGTAQAQRNLPAELFGRGVHAYHARDYTEAVSLLNDSIDAGTDDPRAFYFRGLAHQQLDDAEAATADFDAGADLEALDSTKYVQINQSLIRIQGSLRVQLERHRTEGMKRSRQAQLSVIKERYSRLEKEEEEFLLQTRRSAPLERGGDAVQEVFGDSPGDVLSPFGDQPAVAGPGDNPPAENPPGNEPLVNDPFAKPPGANPPVNDPFAKPPAENPVGVNPPGNEPLVNDPFAKPPGANPLGENPPANDPFAKPPGVNPPAENPIGVNPPGDAPDIKLPTETGKAPGRGSRLFSVFSKPLFGAAEQIQKEVERNTGGAPVDGEFPNEGKDEPFPNDGAFPDDGAPKGGIPGGAFPADGAPDDGFNVDPVPGGGIPGGVPGGFPGGGAPGDGAKGADDFRSPQPKTSDLPEVKLPGGLD